MVTQSQLSIQSWKQHFETMQHSGTGFMRRS